MTNALDTPLGVLLVSRWNAIARRYVGYRKNDERTFWEMEREFQAVAYDPPGERELLPLGLAGFENKPIPPFRVRLERRTEEPVPGTEWFVSYDGVTRTGAQMRRLPSDLLSVHMVIEFLEGDAQ